MTNKEMYLQIREKLVDAEEIAFIDTQIAALDRKAAKAKERAALRKAQGDELREAIFNALTSEPQTIATIIAATGIEDLTSAKVSSRLGQLVSLEKVVREKVKLESGEDRMAYRLA